MQTPTVNSLIFADRVYRDAETKKWIIAGVFNTIGFRSFPARYDWLEVLFQITNVSQKVDLHFRIEEAATGKSLVDVGGPIASPSPLNVVEQKVVLRGLKFPEAGKYWIQLVSNEEILSQTPLYVRKVQPPPPRPPGQGGRPAPEAEGPGEGE
jgi:hypothetical protein